MKFSDLHKGDIFEFLDDKYNNGYCMKIHAGGYISLKNYIVSDYCYGGEKVRLYKSELIITK